MFYMLLMFAFACWLALWNKEGSGYSLTCVITSDLSSRILVVDHYVKESVNT